MSNRLPVQKTPNPPKALYTLSLPAFRLGVGCYKHLKSRGRFSTLKSAGRFISKATKSMSKNNFPSKSLVDSIKSTTFVPTRTRQASPRCSNVRVVLFYTMSNRIPFQKPYASTHDLVRLLQSRGLTVADTAKAERYLEFIGYYRLSAYMYPLLQMPKEQHRCSSRACPPRARACPDCRTCIKQRAI